jgi:hypothetical protein
MTQKTQPFRNRLRHAFRRHYLLTLWLPFLVTVVALFASSLPYPWELHHLPIVFHGINLLGLLYLLVTAIVRLGNKRIAPGLVTLACLVLAILSFIPAMIAGGIAHWIYDDFASDLTIPDDIEISKPASNRPVGLGLATASDSFQRALLESLASPPPSGELTLSLPSLEALQADHPDLLLRFLAAHPGWRVYSERGARHATRRWRIKDRWRPRLHNYYSSFNSSDGPRFQSRTNIGLDGKSWARNLWGSSYQRILPGIPTQPKLKIGKSLVTSSIAVPVGDLLVEQFEQSETNSRPITTTAFEQLEVEFAALASDPTWEHARTLLPEDAITRDTSPSIDLFARSGNFDAHIRCNPGEPGSLYIKAREVTRDYLLSRQRLQTASNERVGWSDNPDELFLSATNFTIREGEGGQHYAANFEVWFQPDSGGPERKLLERIFRIQGWSH